MANEIGFSFQPGSQGISPNSGENRAIGGPQSAVQVKSFTLPNRFVPGQIAPQQLLQATGGGGQLDMNVLRQLVQMFAPQGQQPAGPMLAGAGGGGGIGPAWAGIGGLLSANVPSAPSSVPKDVPLTHTPGTPPAVHPGSTPDAQTGPPATEPTWSEHAQDLFGTTPSGGLMNPLGKNKYEGFSF